MHRRGCWEQAFGNIAYHQGPKQALRIFDQRIASDPAVEAACHRIVHMIGSASLARFKGNVSQAFTAGSASCNSGYYHGILERALVGWVPRPSWCRPFAASAPTRTCAGRTSSPTSASTGSDTG